MRQIMLTILIGLLVTGCASSKKPATSSSPVSMPAIPAKKPISPAELSQLQQGRRLFQDGYYKRAMEQLLPLAVDGNMDAEYAVGYMYYYGFGVAQDTQSGYFWIKRSASQNFEPAVHALIIMQKQDQRKNVKTRAE